MSQRFLEAEIKGLITAYMLNGTISWGKGLYLRHCIDIKNDIGLELIKAYKKDT